MKLLKLSGTWAALTAFGVAGVCDADESKDSTFTMPTRPNYEWKKNQGVSTPPNGGEFPTVGSTLPTFVTGMDPNNTLFVNQQYFDMFSWKVFMALNWPAQTSEEEYGQPLGDDMGAHLDAPRVWETFIPPELVFKDNGATPDPYIPVGSWKDHKNLDSIGKRAINEVDEAFFNLETPLPPIVDTDKHYARYEVRMNKVWYQWIKDQMLYSKDGQEMFLGPKLQLANLTTKEDLPHKAQLLVVVALIGDDKKSTNPTGSLFVRIFDGNGVVIVNKDLGKWDGKPSKKDQLIEFLRENPDSSSLLHDENLKIIDDVREITSVTEADLPLGKPFDFPVGSIEIKAAWKKISSTDDPKRFFTRRIDVLEPNAPGRPTVKNQLYGLVGLHIMYIPKGTIGHTKDGGNIEGPIQEWVWPTFEHVDNAPISDLRPNHSPLPGEPDGKPDIGWGWAQNDAGKWEWQLNGWKMDKSAWNPILPWKRYSFFDPAGPNALTTSIGGFSPESRQLMDDALSVHNFVLGDYYQNKYKALTIQPRMPSQITKVITDNNSIVASLWTHALNLKMREQLPEPWNNYQLVSTQWATQPGLIKKWKDANPYATAKPEATIIAGNPAPVSLGNAGAETYMQINGSCMNCHAGATFGGRDGKRAGANFSFMLQRAK